MWIDRYTAALRFERGMHVRIAHSSSLSCPLLSNHLVGGNPAFGVLEANADKLVVLAGSILIIG